MNQGTPAIKAFALRRWLLFGLWLTSFAVFAQRGDRFEQFHKEVDLLFQQNDTTAVTEAFVKGNAWAQRNKLSANDPDYLEFRLKETRFLLRYSKIAVDSALVRYHSIYDDALSTDNYNMQTKVLGFIANAYRSKRELGKAFEYNQKEITAAKKSNDSLLVGRALITELDIAYNSLPSPMQPEDLNELIEKGNYVIDYSERNQLNSILGFGKLYLSKFYIKQAEFNKAEEILYSISDTEPLPVTFSKYEHLCEIAKETNDLDAYRSHTLAFKSKAYQTKRAFVALNAHNYLLDYSMAVKDEDSSKYYAERLEQNLAEVDTTKYLDFLDISYSSLARFYKGKDAQKELKYTSYSAEINRIISLHQKQAFSAILKYKSELAALESENTDLAKSNTTARNNLILTAGLLLLLGVIAIIIFRKYRSSRRKTEDVLLEKQRIEEVVTKKSIELNNKQRVYLDVLKYMKADRNYVEFHTDDKRFVDRNVLSTVIEDLPPNFVQVHRSYVINKNFIKTSTSSRVILFPDIEIPVSRTFGNRLKEAL
ncbi:LytTR family DNA-binding domain-containing protein [Aureisphaera galaxeae]|uniref:LytR/AlgR family response regulator transcription factor n=1 Tax=Aureisphaera galaxeae TaxID=1538023 RepID=UPI002350154B|nr:LytTR family DNA-binding domain-containing protein [Aureisphaera galaxeae]MDC8004652.1 LytTR family DNA-binding domain-containing protein [Aureisphaera galaxeae]